MHFLRRRIAENPGQNGRSPRTPAQVEPTAGKAPPEAFLS